MTIDAGKLFGVVRDMLGRGLTQAEVNSINAVIDPPSAPKAHTLESPEFFFAGIRKITGALDQVQVDVINDLLSSAAHWSVGWLAYGFATAWHEARLKPIREKGSGDGPDANKYDDYLQKYDTGALAKALGNTAAADGDGIKYAGRGLCQITGRTNYARASDFLGIDLLADPDRVLEPDIAVRILIWGMEKGTFTGKSLATYITPGPGKHDEFVAARRIINGTDRAEMIANYADDFKDALLAGGWA